MGLLGDDGTDPVWRARYTGKRVRKWGLADSTGELEGAPHCNGRAGWAVPGATPPTRSPQNKNALTEHSWTGPLALSDSSGEPVWSPGSTGNRCRPDAGLSRAPCRLSTQGLDQPLLSDLAQSCSVRGGGRPLL